MFNTYLRIKKKIMKKREKISEFTKAVSPVLLPMIATLGDLNIDEE